MESEDDSSAVAGDKEILNANNDDDQESLLNPVQRQLMQYRLSQSRKSQASKSGDTSAEYVPPSLLTPQASAQVSDSRLITNPNNDAAGAQTPLARNKPMESRLIKNPYQNITLDGQSSIVEDSAPIQLSEIPLLNVIDLTKRSQNMNRLALGQIKHPDDLESEIIEDSNLSPSDLAVVEIEVNKRRKRKQKAERRQSMISPASSVRNSVQGQLQARPGAWGINDDREEEYEEDEVDGLGLGGNPAAPRPDLEQNQQQIRDPLMQEQMIGDRFQQRPQVPERIYLCGMIRRRDRRFDICCMKELDKEFLYMLLFVTVIMVCLVFYCVLA